ncbi:hypothetical protein [Burkholderia lata]|uniref:Uncharacterized protein n=1 Tax=Burkholderia lata (strain ATCC 17760 / DSM 23089 / LMG 22485 / NCIMB 9086 / R18194 / 383) TaxID=482957 RepID=A0A6P2XQN1_BURL3|nr:hypothetical protein [Burkholderia lata]VWD12082.1 hypothetical protein BLA18109_05300 [Burkholderia lata]
MTYYGISMIKLDQTGVEVEEAKVHTYFRNDPADPVGLDEGRAMAYHEVANLIVGGDTVFVIVPDAAGVYRDTDMVRVKPGQREYLESFGADGAASGALMALPTYE